MICPSCSMKNNYYHRYCFNCGTRLINEEYEQRSFNLLKKSNYIPNMMSLKKNNRLKRNNLFGY